VQKGWDMGYGRKCIAWCLTIVGDYDVTSFLLLDGVGDGLDI
jgi:hypothetical protein